MKTRAKALLVAAAVICLIPAAAFAGIMDFTQDFESLDAGQPRRPWAPTAGSYYVTVFAAADTSTLYGYGGAAPNTDSPRDVPDPHREGGEEQGAPATLRFQRLQERRRACGRRHRRNQHLQGIHHRGCRRRQGLHFRFQAKMGNLVAPSTALAFIKTIDPANNYDQTNFISEDMTAIPTEWGGWSLELTIDAGLVGQFFQVGFANMATSYMVPSSIVYDNVVLTTVGGGPTGMDPYSQDFEALNAGSLDRPGQRWLAGLRQRLRRPITGDYLYEYGPNPAPNNPAAPAFSTIAVGEGGAEQGSPAAVRLQRLRERGAQWPATSSKPTSTRSRSSAPATWARPGSSSSRPRCRPWAA